MAECVFSCSDPAPYLGELLGVGQIVDSDGQEDVKQSVCGGRS